MPRLQVARPFVITAKANSNLRVEHQLYDSTATLVFKRISCLHLSCLVPLGPRNPHLCQVNGALDTDALEIVACVLAVRADGALTCRRLPTVAWNFHRGNNVPSWRRIVSAASSQYWPQVKHETILAIVLLRRMELLMLHSLHCWQLCTKAWMRGRKEEGRLQPSHTIWQHSGRLCHDKCKMPCRSEALHDRQAQESHLAIHDDVMERALQRHPLQDFYGPRRTWGAQEVKLRFCLRMMDPARLIYGQNLEGSETCMDRDDVHNRARIVIWYCRLVAARCASWYSGC